MTACALATAGLEAGLPPFVEKLLNRWLHGWRGGRVVIEFSHGPRLAYGADAGREITITVHSLRALWRLAVAGSVGWAQAYVEGEWDTPDLSAFLTAAARNLDGLDTRDGTRVAGWIDRFIHRRRANTRSGSRRNIAAHYDLGNEFYRLWLDPSMTYSSAVFSEPSEDLAAAQLRKYRRLCEILNLQSGQRVLEIGCGWGGFAEVAARDYGCHVVALTLSERQATFARQRIARLELESKVEIRLQDYRDTEECYDAIASVEMFEAVGAENWPTYFEVLARRLTPGGRAAIQTITISDAKFERYRRSVDFIQRFIFPGGLLPSPAVFREHASRADLSVADQFFFGAHYAETLRRWANAFNGTWPEIQKLGFDTRFCRLWNYYLSYCEAGFTAGYIDVAQYLLVKPRTASLRWPHAASDPEEKPVR